MNTNTKQIKYPNKLVAIRKARGLRQIDISAKLGFVGEDRICKWEKGTAVPHLINLLKLCQIYNVRAEEIYPTLVADSSCNAEFFKDQ